MISRGSTRRRCRSPSYRTRHAQLRGIVHTTVMPENVIDLAQTPTTIDLSESRKGLDSMMVTAPVPAGDLEVTVISAPDAGADSSDSPYGVPDNGAPVDFNG